MKVVVDGGRSPLSSAALRSQPETVLRYA